MENMGTDVWVKRVNIKLPFRRSYMKDSKSIHLNSQKASQQLKFHPPTQGTVEVAPGLEHNAPNIVYVTNLFDFKSPPILIIYSLHNTST